MTSDHYRLLALLAHTTTLVLVTACVLVFTPRLAHAAQPATSAVRLLSCVSGAAPAERALIVRASMATPDGSRRMAMRFALLRVLPADGAQTAPDAPVQLAVPAWSGWVRAAPGRRRLVVLRRIDGLTGPAVYTVRVALRWSDARGRQVRTVTLDSGPCVQPGPGADGG